MFPVHRIAAVALLSFASATLAAPAEFVLTIRDHKFDPVQITVPAGQKIKLLVKNEDSTTEEFESRELNREKIIVGNSTGVVYVGPLDPGAYPFFGDFHPETATGSLIAK